MAAGDAREGVPPRRETSAHRSPGACPPPPELARRRPLSREPRRALRGGVLPVHGRHRGSKSRRTRRALPGAGAAERTPGLWIGGASDAVSFYINGIYMGTALPRGRSVWLVGRLPWRTGENEIVVRTEIMGHSNFHDATVPVTHLGSMRGLAPPVLISERTPGAGEYEEHVRTASMPSRDASFIYGAPNPAGGWSTPRGSCGGHRSSRRRRKALWGRFVPSPQAFRRRVCRAPSRLPKPRRTPSSMGETAWARDQRGVVARRAASSAGFGSKTIRTFSLPAAAGGIGSGCPTLGLATRPSRSASWAPIAGAASSMASSGSSRSGEGPDPSSGGLSTVIQ